MFGSLVLLGIKDKAVGQSGNHPPGTLSATAGSPKKAQLSSPGRSPKRKRKVNPESAMEREERLEKRKIAKRQKEEAENQPYLILAIDFGCTFTGVAFVGVGSTGNEVEVVNEWPKGGREEKVPTRIAYEADDSRLSQDVHGYKIPAGIKSYGWFKLHLDKKTKPTDFDDPLLASELGLGIGALPQHKSAVDVTVDYLRFVMKETFAFLERRMGEETLEETPIKYFLTTPAMWSFRSRELTRKAALKAGIAGRTNSMGITDKLFIVDEPEAAAIAAIKTSRDLLPGSNPFKHGQSFVVADLGGGTADLVSYKIVSTMPLELEELCIGVGGKCGGTSIDRRLYALMVERYGKAFTSLPPTKTGPGSTFMNQFETCKKIFTCEDPKQTWDLPLRMPLLQAGDGGDHGYDWEEGMISLTCADMERLFEFAVQTSLDLVENQIKLIDQNKRSPARGVVLCGGLGSSPYVKSRFQKFCEVQHDGALSVVQPSYPWSAVCRGAALQGLEGVHILSRCSKAAYGFVAHEEFLEGRHSEIDAYYDPIFGKRAMNQMIWPIKQHERIKGGEPKKRFCQYTVPPDVDELISAETLYQCTAEPLPTRLDSSVRPVGQITIDLTDRLVAERRKAKRLREGVGEEATVVVEVDLAYSMGTDKGVMEITALHGKKEVGKAKIDWEADSHWERQTQIKMEE